MKKMLTLLSVAALSLGAAEQMPLPSGKAEFAPTEKASADQVQTLVPRIEGNAKQVRINIWIVSTSQRKNFIHLFAFTSAFSFHIFFGCTEL